MVHPHSVRRTFCFCIPTRLGVLVLSTLTFFASIVTAWFSFAPVMSKDPSVWIATYKDLSTTSRTILILNGAVSVITGLCALAGLVGAIIRQRRLVGLYSFAVWVLLAVGILLGSLTIWSAYKNKDEVVSSCEQHIPVGDEKADWKKEACADAYKMALDVTCVVFALGCLIQIYLCVVIGRYKHQLDAEHVSRKPVGVPSRSQYEEVHDVEKNGY
ncbi:hypothetical protein CF327_g2099 [Tilletia walkeri]|nr:hypothetical protein CF327_g2099 [Tilletia walkeri]